MCIFHTSVVVVCNDGVPPRLSKVLITGTPFNDSKEFKTRERKHLFSITFDTSAQPLTISF